MLNEYLHTLQIDLLYTYHNLQQSVKKKIMYIILQTVS